MFEAARPVAARPVSAQVLAVCAALVVAGCADYAYVGLPQGQPSREIRIPDGATVTFPLAASIVGLAHDDGTGHIFARNLPGTQLQELDRRGRVLRTFAASRVPAGCGGITPSEFPVKECGLAIRLSDRHLFLDHPGGLIVSELLPDGAHVRHILLERPEGPIGGLAYDQTMGRIYALFIRNRRIGVYDLDGRRVGTVGTTDPATGAAVTIERFGLAINSDRREIYAALHNGNRLGVFDMSGRLKATHPVSTATAVNGIGAGRGRR